MCVTEHKIIIIHTASCNNKVCVCVCVCVCVFSTPNYSIQAQERTVFTVDPFSAVIPPEQRLELTVTAFVDDALK